MFRFYVLLCCFVVINGQLSISEESHPAPEPYNFAYSSSNEDGSSSSREEIGDADGRITGFYTLVGLDGQERRVDYVADENGFRAKVTTNEIGTESKDAADAQYLSSAPSTDQLRAEWEASQSTLQGVKTRVKTQQTLIGTPAILPPAKVATKSQTTAGVSSGLGVSVVGVAPSVGGSVFTRTKSVKTQASGNLNGVSVVRIAQPDQQELTRTVQTQTSSGLGSGGGLSFINLASQVPQRVISGGGLSIAGISAPAGSSSSSGSSSRESFVQTQQLGTKGFGGGGVSYFGISPGARGITRTQTIRTQTTGSSPTLSLSPSLQSVGDISSLLAQQNNGLQGLQGLSLSGLQLIPAGNPLVRYLTNGNGEVQQLQGYNNQGNIILLPEDLNLDFIQSQNSKTK